MPPELMDISTATQLRGLTRTSPNRSASWRRPDRRGIRSLPLLRMVGGGLSRSIGSSARHSTGLSQASAASFVTLTARPLGMIREILPGAVMPKTRPISVGMVALPQASAMVRSNSRMKASELSGPLCRSAFGTRPMPPRSLGSMLRLFGASPPGSETGKASSNSIHGPDAWDRNDWVCAASFRTEKINIDEAIV